MHGVYVPERWCMPVVQDPSREDKQKWHGFTQNGLESLCDSHRGVDSIHRVYLVGVYQGAVTVR